MDNISQNSEISVSANAQAAGQTQINGASVDCSNCDGVVFLVLFGTIVTGAVTTVKAQQSSDNGVSDTFSDLAGTGQTVADSDDNKLFILDIPNPQERYIRPVVTRATQNSTVEGIVAIKYGLRKVPSSHPSTVGGSEVNPSPDEGTA